MLKEKLRHVVIFKSLFEKNQLELGSTPRYVGNRSSKDRYKGKDLYRQMGWEHRKSGVVIAGDLPLGDGRSLLDR